MGKNILKISNLSKEYTNFKLEDINLNIEEGSVVGLIGPNGAGKSTTIKSIMNIVTYDGTIKINDMLLKENEMQTKEEIGYVGEHLEFYEKVKSKDVYQFKKKFYKNWDDVFFYDLIKKFDIDLNKKMVEFSKGMKVKFSLAMELAHHPKLLILDEPTSGLDPVIRNEVLELLEFIVKNEGSSLLFSSHITEDIVKIADRVGFMLDGKLKFISSKKEILENYLYVSLEDCEDEMKEFKKHIKLSTPTHIVIDSTELDKSDIAKLEANSMFRHINLDEVLMLLINATNI